MAPLLRPPLHLCNHHPRDGGTVGPWDREGGRTLGPREDRIFRRWEIPASAPCGLSKAWKIERGEIPRLGQTGLEPASGEPVAGSEPASRRGGTNT